MTTFLAVELLIEFLVSHKYMRHITLYEKKYVNYYFLMYINTQREFCCRKMSCVKSFMKVSNRDVGRTKLHCHIRLKRPYHVI